MTTSLELERLSAVLDPFAISLQGAPQAIASGEQAEMHVRQPENASQANGDADLEVALVLFGLESLFLGGVDRIDTSFTATLEELANVRALLAGRHPQLGGTVGRGHDAGLACAS